MKKVVLSLAFVALAFVSCKETAKEGEEVMDSVAPAAEVVAEPVMDSVAGDSVAAPEVAPAEAAPAAK